MRLNYHRVGHGEPLVLIHGIGSRWQVWEPVLGALAAERDVVALDLPGFADSPSPPAGTPAGVPSLTAFVTEFLDELGLERPHVAGNSLGGWISLELARRGRVRSATALSPAGFHTPAERIYEVGFLWIAVRMARLMAPYSDRLLRRPRFRVAALGGFIGRPRLVPAPDAAASLRALAEAPWFDESLGAIGRDHFGDGTQINVPVTIAWGEHDRLLLPHQAKRAAHQIPSARMLVLRGCGHVPTYDDPQQVAQVLLQGSQV